MNPQPSTSSRVVKWLLVIATILLLNLGGNWLLRHIDFQLFPRHDELMHLMVMGAALLYVLLMALPFMPGIEIGIALMILLGQKGALLVYLCTLAALSVSFVVGKTIPPRYLIRLLDWLHLERASSLLARLAPLDRIQRLELLYATAPSRAVPFLLRHRYLAVAVLLNLPGNAMIGGGGGIGLVCGMSRLFPFPQFVLLVAAAVAPVPLLLYLGIFTLESR